MRSISSPPKESSPLVGEWTRKRARPFLLLIALITAFSVTCTDEPQLTEPPDEIVPSMDRRPKPPQGHRITGLIEALYPPPGLQASALNRWANIYFTKGIALSAAQDQARLMVSDALVLEADGQLLTPDPGVFPTNGPEEPTALDGVGLLAMYLYEFTSLADFGDGDYYPESEPIDDGSGVITPEGGEVTTRHGWARIIVGAGATDEDVLFTMRLDDDEKCNTGNPKEALGCWDFDQYGGGDFQRKVEICVADPGPPPNGLTDSEYFVELRVHKRDEITGAIEVLPRENATLDCTCFLDDSGECGETLVAEQEDPSFLSSIGSAVTDLFLPDPLGAFFRQLRRPPQGIGGSTSRFSEFYGAVPEGGADYSDVPTEIPPEMEVESWTVIEPSEAVELCTEPGAEDCPEESEPYVDLIAEAMTTNTVPPWLEVYFYYKPRGLDGPVTLIGPSESREQFDQGAYRYYDWTVRLDGDEVPDAGEIDVFAVGVMDPLNGGIFGTAPNSYITVVLAVSSPLIVFDKLVYPSQQRDIWVMNSDGSEVRQLTQDLSQDNKPTWSPDGTKIAYQCYGFTGFADISVIDDDGSNLVRVTLNESHNWTPSWSPDSKEIVFNEVNYADGGSYISKVNADGTGGTTRLTDEPGNQTDPVWSPNGAQIAWNLDDDIWVMNADGTEPTPLTYYSGDPFLRARVPRWSPDGTQIAFLRIRWVEVEDPDEEPYDDGAIVVMNADGTEKQDVAYVGDPSFREFEWSPDGTRIVFTHFSYPFEYPPEIEVYSVNVGDPLNPTLLSDHEAREPSWSPDGSRIVYLSRPTSLGPIDIWMMNADGSGKTNLTNTPDADEMRPRWQPGK
jgi:TolB protein